MKRNKKALYELIMKNVSREIKRTLNESVEDEKILGIVDVLYKSLVSKYSYDMVFIFQNILTICESLKRLIQLKTNFKMFRDVEQRLKRYYDGIQKYDIKQQDFYQIPSGKWEPFLDYVPLELKDIATKYGEDAYTTILAAITELSYESFILNVKNLYYRDGITAEQSCEIAAKLFDYGYKLYMKK